MAIFGTEEWAIRLPSALFALATILLLLWYCRRFLKRPAIGNLAMLVLITSPGFLHTHIARTADTDAMLIFFIAFYSFCFVGFIQTKDRRNAHRFLLAAMVGVLFTFFTKGIAGFIPIPGLLLFGLYAKKLGGISWRDRSCWRLPTFA
jgi:4-amino-4-deoxy-L-arabinose transferase-like glycosyltransferase